VRSLLVVSSFLVVLALWLACAEEEATTAAVAAATLPHGTATFVRDAECAACHPVEVERWTGSHHDLAMQPATEETVLGDFDDALFEARGVRTRFHRDGERFLVDTVGPDGERADFEVAWVFGVDPLQQLLLPLPGGRLQAFSVAWDVAGARWYSLYPDERLVPGDPLHWTGRYQRWNTMCAACHSTDLAKRYDVATDSYATTWAEVDVGCQACHGPGSEHVAWAAAAARGEEHATLGKGLTTALRRHAQREQLDACAPCHSRRAELTGNAPPGAPFLDHFLPERLHEGFYHADGQVQDEVYVYGSFVQSKMGLRGVACSDCHDPHSLEPLASGNGLCAQCHTSHNAPVERFPTLTPKDYDTPEHHRHAEGSEGARCVSCHMPAKTFMGIDARRDHSFRIPRPDLSVVLGTPDACSACHVEGAAWAAERIAEWFGPERPRHFAPVLAMGRARMPEALGALAGLSADVADTPAIVRATALELLRGYGNQALQVAVGSLADPDPLVRAAAAGALDGLPAQARVVLLTPLLSDPLRAVRIEAGRALSSLAKDEIPAEHAAALESAVAEFVAAQDAQADLPSAHLNLGIFHAGREEWASAEADYRTALRLDPSFLPARFNLANLLNGRGRNADAERVLRDGLELHPADGELYFSLALLLAEMKRMDEAADAMTAAARIQPDRTRVHYNLGLLLKEVGRQGEAEVALEEAMARAPQDPDPVHALVLIYKDRDEWQRALPLAEKLVVLRRGDPASRELLEEVRRGLER